MTKTSARRGKKRNFREPNREEFRIIRGAAPLSAVFSDEQVAEKLVLAKRRIVSIFHHATEWRRGKYRKTDNYIIGVAERQHNLANYIIRQMNQDFIYLSDLPESMMELSNHYLDETVSNLQYRLVLAQLNQMCAPIGVDIWYDDAIGIWQMAQSCHDQMIEQAKSAAKAAVKFDRRNWHGRPREQARRRGTPPGASISYPPR